MINNRLHPQNLASPMTVSIILAMLPVFFIIITMLGIIFDIDTPREILLSKIIINIGISGCFTYILLALRKYILNFGSTPTMSLIMLITTIVVVASCTFNTIAGLILINTIDNVPLSGALSAVDFVRASDPSNQLLVDRMMLVSFWFSKLSWLLLFISGIFILIECKKDFVGGLVPVTIAISTSGILGIILRAEPFTTNGIDYILIFIIAVFCTYMFSKARRYIHWFGSDNS